MACSNNLHQIGIACHQYHDVRKVLPPGICVPVDNGASGDTFASDWPQGRIIQPPMPNLFGSWLMWILPYVEQGSVYSAVGTLSSNYTQRDYTYCGSATAPGATVISTYICPTDYVPRTVITYTNDYFAINSYRANAGTSAWPLGTASLNGVMFYNSKVNFLAIIDGTSNTLLAGELFARDASYSSSQALEDSRGWAWCNWNSGQDVLADTAYVLNSPAATTGVNARRVNFGSGHGNGANFLLCDGSVAYITNNINIVTYQRLSVPNDGNPVSIP
jgi:prepilin-type processing-associated H-X9-DG protein